ncbi:hypothetical protein MLD38_006948 [Melastoma candidum]|uniref:Uncharacterized protein n=1 Tax=Melastoma candidum TaxID=119954 RepID=A0ACB9RPH5_9MYRT|nr:hypothetical protein MLD38_006948 [Melastoma candidum]
MSTADLFAPLDLGKLKLSHRVVLAPLTRCRAFDGVPQPAMVEYYKQRATEGGLLITEATAVSPVASGYPRVPGIYTDEQVEGWKKVVDAVHSEGAIIFCQLWHAGRASHRAHQPEGGETVSSTNTPISEKWKALLPDGTEEAYSVPRALDTAEVPWIIKEFQGAAINSVRAGFDGIEVHGAHGYLVDQFLKETINDRSDMYGGSVENRLRLLMDILQGVVQVFGTERVGVRISPVSEYNDAAVPDPLNLGLSIIKAINEFQTKMGSRMCYLHVTRPRFLLITAGEEPLRQQEELKLMRAWREAYRGSFMSSGGYTRDLGTRALADGDADLIAYGRLFISNPDLVLRFRVNARLNAYDRDTFYTGDPVVGYTDYPFLGDDLGNVFLELK